ncbi:hypothetical protein PGH07_05965 [Sulfurovum sp. zt1-1]|uniref:Phage protein n=1 Tax=Sulfurovum zhangzhouensis TaxID=3019067 RepID=A0ABT7QY05_9BACT|nr:hypothetical protein [Sulfurovum zhangzhouensis]MDM5271714.1 hypothetical protein [Sulfurovum zhangzhouensis]
MTIDEIRFEMSINEVKPNDIEEIIEECIHSGFSPEDMDTALQKRGYPKIFTIDYDELDMYDEDAWDDD